MAILPHVHHRTATPARAFGGGLPASRVQPTAARGPRRVLRGWKPRAGLTAPGAIILAPTGGTEVVTVHRLVDHRSAHPHRVPRTGGLRLVLRRGTDRDLLGWKRRDRHHPARRMDDERCAHRRRGRRHHGQDHGGVPRGVVVGPGRQARRWLQRHRRRRLQDLLRRRRARRRGRLRESALLCGAGLGDGRERRGRPGDAAHLRGRARRHHRAQGRRRDPRRLGPEGLHRTNRPTSAPGWRTRCSRRCTSEARRPGVSTAAPRRRACRAAPGCARQRG